MALAVLGLGSNIARERHLGRAIEALAQLAAPEPVSHSRVFESPPVGFEDARHFYNLVVAFETPLDANALNAHCKTIERDNGRDEVISDRGRSKSPRARTLDIDLLLLGDLCIDSPTLTLPRCDIERFAFVLHPLAELLPDHHHPVFGATYAELWSRFDATRQPHWPVAVAWTRTPEEAPATDTRDDLHNA
ncbi:2-amino-4-hydroxy-6-hydroxymethyldihydropteridine diphosphokinase [Salinicola aestuarinus]|uniref:2-amino-4-hydroxy-6- hydroxymethyldihydropteridine diphosphokinase n=1 Tax=Salinicola aestuarinus TaxID=1949082 RepID=UPI000DA1C170|nr:2-amino-4-hydroxy-6-hydroxymethyldihydropteridine diphosphokinase [Salinicola aestuarinus]